MKRSKLIELIWLRFSNEWGLTREDCESILDFLESHGMNPPVPSSVPLKGYIILNDLQWELEDE